jgi:hydroxyacylglutathione hydrolase
MKITGIPALNDNYIWLIGSEGDRRVVIVDPGEAAPVIAFLQQQQLIPQAILITHHHRDHHDGVTGLLNYAMPEVFGPDDARIPHLTRRVGEGDRITLPGIDLAVWHTPGHTRSHLCYVGDGYLFAGDTLFTAGCGRLFEGSAAEMWHSLQRISALPPTTLLYCAHEYTADNLRFAAIAEPDNRAIQQRQQEVAAARAAQQATVPAPLALELATNPFLRCHLPELAHNAAHWADRPLNSASEVFSVVRAWKDALD